MARSNHEAHGVSMKRKSLSILIDKDKKKKKKAATTVGSSSRSRHQNNLCGICFDFKADSEMFVRKNCNHSFCTECVKTHVLSQVNSNVVNVKCPFPNCYEKLKPEQLRHVLSKRVIVQWESAIYENSISLEKKLYCPFRNCSVLLVNDVEDVTSSECPYCHRLFCAKCKVPWHAEMNCREYRKLKNEKDLDKEFLKLAKSKAWQKCPKCSMYVQRSIGCEHMICRCGCHFCYCCGKDWAHGHICNH